MQPFRTVHFSRTPQEICDALNTVQSTLETVYALLPERIFFWLKADWTVISSLGVGMFSIATVVYNQVSQFAHVCNRWFLFCAFIIRRRLQMPHSVRRSSPMAAAASSTAFSTTPRTLTTLRVCNDRCQATRHLLCTQVQAAMSTALSFEALASLGFSS